MRKATILFAVLFAATASTAADAAKKQAAKKPTMTAQEQSNMFIRDAFQPWTTSLSSPKPAAKKAAKKKV